MGPVATSGVPGLDEVTRGGYPRGTLLLVEGDPGVGKTTLALQFLMQGAREGEPCLYVTLSETKAELVAVAQSHGWTLDGIEIHELAAGSLLTDDESTLFHPSEMELAETTKSVVELCKRVAPKRVVLDSLSEIRLLAQSPLRYRREVLALKQYFSGRGCTVLLLDDRTGEASEGHLKTVAHGVITLEQLAPLYGAQRRRLRVSKLRGVDFRGGYHDFVLARGGIEVFPRLVASKEPKLDAAGVASSGVTGLDSLLGGGFDRGTSTLLLGPAGTGKSTLAVQCAIAASGRGERSVIYAFDESARTLRLRSASLGMDLESQERMGRLTVHQIDPAEVPPGQFAARIRRDVEQGVRIVVIDSLNGYLHAMPDESFLVLQLHELLTYLGQQGVCTIMVVAQHGILGAAMGTPTDVSYVADTVLLLRHFEIQGALSKALSVLKRRTGRHEATIRELRMDSRGVFVGEPLKGLRGIMTGVPTVVHDGLERPEPT